MSSWVGWLEVDARLGDVHSLKAKRSVVRPVVAELQRALRVAVAETEHVELHRRTGLTVAVVASDRAHVVAVLDRAEDLLSGHPELEVLSALRRVLRTDDV